MEFSILVSWVSEDPDETLHIVTSDKKDDRHIWVKLTFLMCKLNRSSCQDTETFAKSKYSN